MGAGVGLCIAATEVQRYTVLWPTNVLSWSTQERYAWLLILLAFGFAGMTFLSTRRGRRLHSYPALPWSIASISSAGIIACSLVTFGILPPSAPVRILIAIAMELPYFLMAVWASWLLTLERHLAMEAVALGIIVAGVIQIIVSLLLGHPFSYVLAPSLAPASVLMLRHLAHAKCAHPDPEAENMGLPATKPDWKAPCPPSLLWVTCSLLVVASLAVYIIHLQWTGIRDQGSASLLVQICTGLGMLVAGILLYVASKRLETRSMTDFCFMLVLPAAAAGLYLSQTIDGVALIVSVIPLNVVYASLLFFVWSIPFAYRTSMEPETLSLLAFFLKRAGVLVCPLLITMLSALGVDLVWLTFGAIIALVGLDAARYLIEHSTPGADAHDGNGDTMPDRYARACRQITDGFSLTARESEVLALLGRGRTARHIAQSLDMSDATVKTHIAHIYRKLSINSQQQLLDIVERQTEQVS